MFQNNRILLAILALALLLSACGTSAETQAPTAIPAVEEPAPVVEEQTGLIAGVNPADYSGAIAMAGSSTVYPLAERMADLFHQEGFAGNITIDSIGTGGGFERFCVAGDTDIANASRPIKDEEVATARPLAAPRSSSAWAPMPWQLWSAVKTPSSPMSPLNSWP